MNNFCLSFLIVLEKHLPRITKNTHHIEIEDNVTPVVTPVKTYGKWN